MFHTVFPFSFQYVTNIQIFLNLYSVENKIQYVVLAKQNLIRKDLKITKTA